ncbi:MAG: TIGR02757 family protein, partial [Bacteroidales bacterium]|nr:TIGR02757 family protein [Bacteroidales bacterium]
PEKGFESVESSLTHFNKYFFNHENAPKRTQKHVASPAKKSACKRLNMFLRWMVRKDKNGVDFGIWNQIPMSELICPLDLHVERAARKLGLITRKPVDWTTALELTENLKKLDKNDPVKYDFALFGLSIDEDITSFSQKLEE